MELVAAKIGLLTPPGTGPVAQALAEHPGAKENCGLGLGFRVLGFGFWVQGSGFRVQGSGFRVQGLGF